MGHEMLTIVLRIRLRTILLAIAAIIIVSVVFWVLALWGTTSGSQSTPEIVDESPAVAHMTASP